MYRLLIVDDEDIEREGMAQLIRWEEYDIELVGTARNGIEGYALIEKAQPDIVLTDIKMPVMNGIELIRKVQKDHSSIVFVVLSGYGEYEYTSQAMELGVRHYILKPCDEHKIMHVLDKVKNALEQNRRQNASHQEMAHTVQNLMPMARENIFRYALLGKEQPVHQEKLSEEVGSMERRVLLLALQSKAGFSYDQHQSIVESVIGLVHKRNVLFSTTIENMLFLLVDASAAEGLGSAVAVQRRNFTQENGPLLAAASQPAPFSQIRMLYDETLRMFNTGYRELQTGLLTYAGLAESQRQAEQLVDFSALRQAKNYHEIYYECFVSLVKMNRLHLEVKQKKATFEWALRSLFGEPVEAIAQKLPEGDWEMLASLSDAIAGQLGMLTPDNERERKKNRLIHAFYENSANQEMSIQFLVEKKLFMNADYLGRQYDKIFGEKFSRYLLRTRIMLAKRLIDFEHDIKISELAETVGYAPDGQYFSKVFRKVIGVSPNEYKKAVSGEGE